MKPIASIHSLRSDRKVMAIVQDTSHPANHLFHPLPSERRYRAMRARTSRLQNSFYPQAIRSFSVCACVRARTRRCVCVQVCGCGCGCCFGGADGCIPLIMFVDVCQCCCLLMFACLPLSRHFPCCKTW